MKPTIPVYIFYYLTSSTSHYHACSDRFLTGLDQNYNNVLLRLETVYVDAGEDALMRALDLAEPRENEVVLNTVLAPRSGC